MYVERGIDGYRTREQREGKAVEKRKISRHFFEKKISAIRIVVEKAGNERTEGKYRGNAMKVRGQMM
jgi:hypothetical protein